MIQTQVRIASKITGVMLVLCNYILGMICLLNAQHPHALLLYAGPAI